MSMEITWLDFQLSTNKQNGRHLRGCMHYSFSRENEAMAAIFIFNYKIPC